MIFDYLVQVTMAIGTVSGQNVDYKRVEQQNSEKSLSFFFDIVAADVKGVQLLCVSSLCNFDISVFDILILVTRSNCKRLWAL